MITTKQVRNKIKVLDNLIEEYKSGTVEKKRDWRTYEEKLFLRTKKAILFFDDYIVRAVESLDVVRTNNIGRPEKLSIGEKVRILLIQRLINKSNREMSFMLLLFSSLNKINISYKTVERIYDDSRVILVLHNIHNLIISEKKVKNSHASGDGTGYVLSIKDHYASISSKIKDKKSTKKRKVFFSFTLMDVEKRIYTAFGTSFKSEKAAYIKAKRT